MKGRLLLSGKVSRIVFVGSKLDNVSPDQGSVVNVDARSKGSGIDWLTQPEKIEPEKIGEPGFSRSNHIMYKHASSADCCLRLPSSFYSAE